MAFENVVNENKNKKESAVMTRVERVVRMMESVEDLGLPNGNPMNIMVPDTQEWLSMKLDVVMDMAREDDDGGDNDSDILLAEWEEYFAERGIVFFNDKGGVDYETNADGSISPVVPAKEAVDNNTNTQEVTMEEKVTRAEVRRAARDEARTAEKESKQEMARKQLAELKARATTKYLDVAGDSILNQVILKRKPQTLKMVRVVMRKWTKLDYKEQWIESLVPANRLFRTLGLLEVDKDKTLKDVVLTDGSVVDLNTTAKYYQCRVKLAYVDFVGEPTNPNAIEQANAHEQCLGEIKHGIKLEDGTVLEYTESSSSQQRTLKGVYVPENFTIPEDYLAGFDLTIEGCKEYVEFLKTLKGAEAIYEIMTYGGYSLEFMNKNYSPAKFGARVGTCQTSSISLGNDYKVGHIGLVKVKFEAVEDQLRAYYLKHFNAETVEKIIKSLKGYTDDQGNVVEGLWKEEKLDGQSMIRASALKKGLRRLGLKSTIPELIGKLIQLRWAGVKGTAFVMPDKLMDNCAITLEDGTVIYPYRGYDMVVEHSSWKYSPNLKFYTGKMAPDLELVQISKAKHSNSLNYQFVQALDGDGNRNIKTKDMFTTLIDRMYEKLWNAMNNPEVAKSILGMNSMDEISEALDIDSYSMTLKSKASSALDAHDEIVRDPWWRLKILNLFAKTEEDASYGKILIEGANRFVISDPTAMLRTDRAENVKQLEDGSYTFDIVIRDIDDLAVRDVVGVYWNDNFGPAVLFRSPCVHPGEPQRTELQPLENIPESIPTAYGSIPARELFAHIKEVCVINCFNFILDVLGGADTDGDTVLVVTDPIVVKLRSLKRLSLLTKTDGGQFKTLINPAAQKSYMAESLKDSGIGRITNWGTTWRDIESMVIHMQADTKGRYRLPWNVRDALKNCASEAKKTLRVRGDKMDAYEKQCVTTISEMHDINVDDKAKEWTNSVLKGCEAALKMCRKLQETSIDTAKTGVWVFYEMINGKLEATTKYDYLKLSVRATWHRKTKEELNYNSWSVMGFVDAYADKKWKELKEKALKTAKVLDLGTGDSELVLHKEVNKAIRELKAAYGKEIYALDKERSKVWPMDDDTKDEFKRKFNEINIKYHDDLKKLSITKGISIDMMSTLIYNASNDGDDKNTGEGISFAWMCWADELIHTLKHRSSGKNTKRLVAVSLAKQYATCVFTPGEYDVVDGKVTHPSVPEEVIGFARVADGLYTLENYNEMPYLVIEKEKPKVEALSNTISGITIRLIGFLHKEYNGAALDRNTVKRLLTSPIGAGLIAVRSAKSGKVENGEELVAAMVYVRTEVGKPWTCIGNIPQRGNKEDDSKFWSQALHDKVLRVEIPKEADGLDKLKNPKPGQKESRLTLKVIEVIKDLNA